MMEMRRYRAAHLQSALTEWEIPGNWGGKSGLQNVYNLIEGRVMPKDSYIFIFLSEFLQVNLREVLLRYTVREVEEVVNEDNKIDW